MASATADCACVGTEFRNSVKRMPPVSSRPSVVARTNEPGRRRRRRRYIIIAAGMRATPAPATIDKKPNVISDQVGLLDKLFCDEMLALQSDTGVRIVDDS